jgi:hypothetical protein
VLYAALRPLLSGSPGFIDPFRATFFWWGKLRGFFQRRLFQQQFLGGKLTR